MKKMFFFAAAASVAFASCTKDVEAPVNNVANDEAAIVFQLGNPLSVNVTRGQGAVGGTEAEGNAWNGETLHVYMFERDEENDLPTMNLAKNQSRLDYEGNPMSYFENAEVTAPIGLASDVADYGTPQYFPSKGDFDFYAYHGNDAVVEIPTNVNGNAYTVPVTIDGTQDLMVAKAALNDDDEQIIDDHDLANPDKTFDRTRIYSAYAARRGVNPRLTFKHLLSRFVFQAVAAEPDAAGVDGIQITAIEVEAPSTGVMTVAALDANALGVVFDQDNVVPMSLKSRTVNADGSFTMNNALDIVYLTEADYTRLGESLLLPAGATEYTAKIHYLQYKDGQPITDTYIAPIVLENNKPFEAGYQYKVNITVYGFKEIVLTADLEAWKEGEDIPFDGE